MHSGVVARVQSTHGFLGILGYVQFTSPIRRYVDLLAHYQGKHARGRETMKSAVYVNRIFCVMVIDSLEIHFTYHFVNPHCVWDNSLVAHYKEPRQMMCI